MTHNFDSALDDFRRCIQLQPQSADAFREIAHIHEYLGQLQLAKSAIEASLSIGETSEARSLAEEIDRQLNEPSNPC